MRGLWYNLSINQRFIRIECNDADFGVFGTRRKIHKLIGGNEMKNNLSKLLAFMLALVMVLSVCVACSSSEKPAEDPVAKEDNQPAADAGEAKEPEAEAEAPVEPVYEDVNAADAIVHADYTSVYSKIGSQVTIDMVEEDEDTGFAYVTVDGVKYELGMDFLSMAMVYNCQPAGEFATDEDAYNEWWKLYMQRWNYLMPEVPLYSNQYFDLYNAKLENFVTSPYWSATRQAVIGASVKEGEDNSIILGSSTDLSGMFRNSSWGKSSPASSDQDVQMLTTGFYTSWSDMSGAYQWDYSALAEEPVGVVNEDGSLTYTIKIRNDLVFSDGSPITAKNYVARTLSNSTAVGMAAGGTGNAGMTLVGYDAFKAYEGEGDTVYFEGVKIIDDYTFSLTFQPDYANYYYAKTYASAAPDPLALYLGTAEIIVNENGSCGLSADYYAKTEVNDTSVYTMAEVISNNMKWDSGLPWSGPYVVENYDASTLTATLKLNPNYPGDNRGKASIETITYIKIVSTTQMDMFTTGQVDVLAGITGGDDTKAALAVVQAEPDKYAETHYDRAGYGKLAFRCDLGPTAFASVRQAITYTINRPQFAQTFTGGYGSVVHGPYYEGMSAFQATADVINLNNYAYSADSAIEVLEEDGWIYNDKGQAFDPAVDAVRYRKLSGYELSEANILYATVDNAYKTLKINGEYYMPLAVNWYGTQPNNVTDQLITDWQTSPTATTAIGMYITYTAGEFQPLVYGDYCQMEAFGFNGTARCCAVNFATGFNSAIYDQSFYWTIDQSMYADYSNNYLMDEADFLENY